VCHAALGILLEHLRAIVTVQVANPNTADSVRHERDAPCQGVIAGVIAYTLRNIRITTGTGYHCIPGKSL